MSLSRTLFAAAGLVLTMFLMESCDNGSSGSKNPPVTVTPTVTPLKPVNPQLLWTGDAQIHTLAGNHGVTAAIGSLSSGIVLVPDGTGGAFAIWESDWQEDVFVQRLSRDGQSVWPAEVSVAPRSPVKCLPAAIGDDSGGVIVAWVDGRDGLCDLGFKANCHIYAQRFDSAGKALWVANGMPVVVVPHANQGVTGIAITPDGSGGAILSWEDSRDPGCTIFAQRIDARGKPIWPVNGRQVSPPPTVVIGSIMFPPEVIGDGTGGAIVAWWNIQHDPTLESQTVSVQKLDPSGNLIWQPSGVTVGMDLLSVNDSGERHYFRIVSDGTGGVIFAANQNIDTTTEYKRFVVAQHVDALGQNTWNSGGVRVSSATGFQFYPALMPLSGGAIVTWRNCSDFFSMKDCSLMAQRLDSSGQVLWGEKGVLIKSASSLMVPQEILPDDTGGAVIVWNDCRDFSDLHACNKNMDVYGQRINGNGQTLWDADGFPISTAAGNQGVTYTTESIPTSYAFINDGEGGFILAWPDGRHNSCFAYGYAYGLDSSCELFAQKIKP